MKKFLSIPVTLLAAATLLGIGGCSYFNTYYDVQKKFHEAERDNNRQQSNQAAGQPGGPRPGQPGRPGLPPQSQQPQGGAIDKYRKVIETAAKLLEYYPKSRWVDDTLLLMGISYYRLQDYSRAERKFTELITIFPKSKHVSEAGLWKARALVAEGRPDDAIALLVTLGSELKGRHERGDAEALLANTEYERQRVDDAAPHFKMASDLLPASEAKYDALYHYGVCEFDRKEFDEALKAFVEVARSTHDRQRSFDANIYGARAALAAGDAPQAEQILKRLKRTSDFEALTADVDLELANLAVQTGRVDEGIAAYETYLQNYPESEKRGVAFFRLANIFRTHRVDLPRAKDMLDSAMHAGASREISDSARAVHEEIAEGLQVLLRFKTLQDSVAHLEARRDTLKLHLRDEPPVPSPIPTSPRDTTTTVSPVLHDSSRVDTVSETPPSQSVIPAPLADDSLSRVLQQKDSVVTDSSHSVAPPDSARVDTARVDTAKFQQSVVPPPVQNARAALDSVEHKLRLARAGYQLAALRVAEFYGLSLGEPDSALMYYKIAAQEKDHRETFWKANLYLAEVAAGDSAHVNEAHQYYQAIVDADSVPRAVMHEARQALGLAISDTGSTAQAQALRMAEQASLTNQVPPDSAVELYGSVVAFDSTSLEARSALFAQLHLYEDVLLNSDSSRAVAHRIIALFPDSSFSEKLRIRVLPPDSGSIFLKSDEQLYPHAPAQGSVVEETPTEGGWPPPEESLRGRRFE
jgi:tetratricopeptide (TPR) repeat protein